MKMKSLICLLLVALQLLTLEASEAKFFDCETEVEELGYQLHASIKLDGYVAFMNIDCEWSNPIYRKRSSSDNSSPSEQLMLFKFIDAEGFCLHYSTKRLSFNSFVDEDGSIFRRCMTYDDSFSPEIIERIDHVEMVVLTRPVKYTTAMPDVVIPDALHGLWYLEDEGYIQITENDIVFGYSSFISQVLDEYGSRGDVPALRSKTASTSFNIEIDMSGYGPDYTYGFSVEDQDADLVITMTDSNGRADSFSANRVL